MPGPRRVLILGGTGEARVLAELLAERENFDVVVSLAGRTSGPVPSGGGQRRGGFGGTAGLATYLKEQRIDALIDATHPFADQISRHARLAAEACGVARLVLRRPAWVRLPEDRWIEVSDHAAAAAALPGLGRRVWLSFGDGLEAFAGVADTWCLVRRIEPMPEPPPLPCCEIVLGRGPFTVADERALIAHHRIDVLLSKASGGDATFAKIVAARELGLPVVMIRRPPPEPGPAVDTPIEAVAWLLAMLDGSAGSTA
jgi:precorrin-6A/cobalt-precorrin-6A reductase